MSCAYFKQTNFDDNGYYTTMNKMLPIGLFSALFLTACGGSDGGSSAPAVKTYNLQFLQMRTEDPESKGKWCNPTTATIFNTQEIDGVIQNTYGLEATSGFEVIITDANNEVQSRFDSRKISPKGTLTLSDNQIPNGGYVSIIEKDNLSDKLAYALSIQKELLSDRFIKVNTNQGKNAGCYAGNALKVNSSKKKVTIDYTSVQGISQVSAETYFSGKTEPNAAPTINNLTVIHPTEWVLLSGYDDSNTGTPTDITHYSYVSSNELTNYTPASTRSNKELLPVVDVNSIQINVDLDAGTEANQPASLKPLVVNSLYKGHSFNWFSWVESKNYYEVSAPIGAGYAYSAQYNVHINGWNVVSNNVISGGEARVNLTADVHPISGPLALTCSGSVNCEFNLSDVTSQDVKGTMVYYTFTDGEFTMKHTVYAKGPIVKIPEVVESRYPTDGLEVNASFITSDSNSKNITDIFSVFGRTKGLILTADKVEMFLPPALSLKHEELKIKNNYTVFTK